MTTFRSRILQCPHCDNKMYTYELTSYFVHSSVVFCDGKVDSIPSRSLDRRILICNECNKAMWSEDALLEGENRNISHDGLAEAQNIHDLLFTFNDDFPFKLAEYYNTLLESGFTNTVEREVYLRVELWRLLNNKERYKPTSTIHDLVMGSFKEVRNKLMSEKESASDNNSSTDLYKDNLTKLINIFDPINGEQELLLAEMYRELGDFSKAMVLLNDIKCDENKLALKRILAATKRKQSKVIKIN